MYYIQDTECCICMGDIHRNSKNILQLECDHYFHILCGIQWLKISNSCPICRRKVFKEIDRLDVQGRPGMHSVFKIPSNNLTGYIRVHLSNKKMLNHLSIFQI